MVTYPRGSFHRRGGTESHAHPVHPWPAGGGSRRGHHHHHRSSCATTTYPAGPATRPPSPSMATGGCGAGWGSGSPFPLSGIHDPEEPDTLPPLRRWGSGPGSGCSCTPNQRTSCTTTAPRTTPPRGPARRVPAGGSMEGGAGLRWGSRPSGRQDGEERAGWGAEQPEGRSRSSGGITPTGWRAASWFLTPFHPLSTAAGRVLRGGSPWPWGKDKERGCSSTGDVVPLPLYPSPL